MSNTYFKGLNSLRFFAASFVILSHIPTSNELPYMKNNSLLMKGIDGVNFFFTLSGFLITYLLIEEREQTGTIQIKKFYIRRMVRIWPLYFLIVGIGLFVYFYLFPTLGVKHKVNFNTNLFSTVLLLYIFFLPNVVLFFFNIGRILNVTWSIGIEEQFYIVWAPVAKYFYKYILWISIGLFLFFLGLHSILHYIISPGPLMELLLYLNFHYIAFGAIGAYLLYHHRDRLLDHWIFSSIIAQVICVGLLASYYLLYHDQFLLRFYHKGIIIFLYIWIILNVSSNEKSFFRLENRILKWLGMISYGIYMYHMIVIYLVSLFFKKTGFLLNHFILFNLVYYIVVFGLTILIAYVSYQFFEKKFLRLKSEFKSI